MQGCNKIGVHNFSDISHFPDFSQTKNADFPDKYLLPITNMRAGASLSNNIYIGGDLPQHELLKLAA